MFRKILLRGLESHPKDDKGYKVPFCLEQWPSSLPIGGSCRLGPFLQARATAFSRVDTRHQRVVSGLEFELGERTLAKWCHQGQVGATKRLLLAAGHILFRSIRWTGFPPSWQATAVKVGEAGHFLLCGFPSVVPNRQARKHTVHAPS